MSELFDRLAQHGENPKIAWLTSVPLFEHVPRRQLAVIAANLDEVHADAGETLVHENQHNDTFWILLDGEVDLIIGGGAASDHRSKRILWGDQHARRQARRRHGGHQDADPGPGRQRGAIPSPRGERDGDAPSHVCRAGAHARGSGDPAGTRRVGAGLTENGAKSSRHGRP